jgi:hypothetical protein
MAQGQRVGEATGLGGRSAVGGGRYAPDQGLASKIDSGEFWAVSLTPLSFSGVSAAKVPDAFILGGWVEHAVEDGRAIGDTLTWTFKMTTKSAVAFADGIDAPGTLLVNDLPIARFGPQTDGRLLALLNPAEIRDDVRAEGHFVQPGSNTITAAFDAHGVDASTLTRLKKSLKVYRLDRPRTGIDAGGQWSFHRWMEPPADRFEGDDSALQSGRPAWFRTEIELPGATANAVRQFGAWLELDGLKRGRVLISGHDAGAYDLTGKAEGWPVSERRVWIRPEWFEGEGETPASVRVTIFDETGKAPGPDTKLTPA